MKNGVVRGCYVFGGDSLLIECCEVLLAKGFTIEGVVSRDSRIENWASESKLRFISLDDDYMPLLGETEFDYLFSITHLEKIDDAVLALPSKLAINFHDGPLPQYSGLNCPAWAIINGETEYGISWHEMTADIDRGSILRSQTFEISEDETSLTLNTKCFAAALESFPLLLDNILADSLVNQEQPDENYRSYRRYDRPDNLCFIDWQEPAEKGVSLVRALDFGAYPNPLGKAKIADADDTIWFVDSASLGELQGPAAQIVSISDDAVEVACASGSIRISEIRSYYGTSLSLSEWVKAAKLAVGVNLQASGDFLSEATLPDSNIVAKEESFWLQRLSNLEVIQHPGGVFSDSNQPSYQSISFPVDGLPDGISNDTVPTAFAVLLAKLARKTHFNLSISDCKAEQSHTAVNQLYAREKVIDVVIEGSTTLGDTHTRLLREIKLAKSRQKWCLDQVVRQPALQKLASSQLRTVLPTGLVFEEVENSYAPPPGTELVLVLAPENGIRLVYDQNILPPVQINRLLDQINLFCQAQHSRPNDLVDDIQLLDHIELVKVLKEWNNTGDSTAPSTLNALIEAQVEATPDSTALVFRNRKITYKELNQRSNALAHDLVRRGVKADFLVGVHIERSIELLVATLGVLKAGGAYVPLDPAFPADRINYMISDAKIELLITDDNLQQTFGANYSGEILLTSAFPEPDEFSDQAPETALSPDNLAYVIYTSGSTGLPKGVMVEHRNVANFCYAMNKSVPNSKGGTWLAVTSLSFDISVLELFWTLTRGYKVIIYKDDERTANANNSIPLKVRQRPMDFGLFMWGNDDGQGKEKYRLMLEGAKYFDENGFNSIWTPERHFHAFGGPYPNPAVTGAALAAITQNLSIRAGSCVSPLHHPIRIAEDWAVIDNISNGRVGLSFASGWQPNDFVIKPENHADNKNIMLDQIETVRKLWRGEKVPFENPMGQMVDTQTLPRPVQPELPVWVTTAGNPETYKQAGAQGANVLTHLLGQTIDELAEKIALYRDARREAGFDPAGGVVTLMLHTFAGADKEQIRELVRQPMKDYLSSAMKLAIDFAWSFPAFKRPGGTSENASEVDIKSLSAEDTDTILNFAFERYFENSGLFGTPEDCCNMIDRCKQADINEIACLLDFGVNTDDIMTSLPYLKQVRDLSNQEVEPTATAGFSFSELIDEHDVTHMQCTPSMARMLTVNPDTRESFKKVPDLLVGGEPISSGLVQELAPCHDTLTNMYGPTETTIWSTTHTLSADQDKVLIGKPILNTEIYILDSAMNPLPPGIAGDLYIGGSGVVRGYLNRPELNSERFKAHPFEPESNQRLYWTGDLARYCENGEIEFLGRIDNQVKIRGYRIELGEIESTLENLEDVEQAVVVVNEETEGDQRLIAYIVAHETSVDTSAIREATRAGLPEYMVPSEILQIERLPLTPNGKIDRNALPSPGEIQSPRSEAEYVAPEGELEGKLVSLWQSLLKTDQVGVNDNFFDLGGHSLLIVQLHAGLKESLPEMISLTDLYRFPTIRTLVDYLQSDGATENLKKSSERAQLRRQMAGRRRRRT